LITLLDTQVVVWAQIAPRQLSRAARSAIQRAGKRGERAISVYSLYEIVVMFERGRIERRGSVDASLRVFTEGLLVLPITLEIAALTTELPANFPRDPGDRIIAATALSESLPLVTADREIQNSGVVRTVW
jgi:PIN domain nuclease of toxin-antitoxin system